MSLCSPVVAPVTPDARKLPKWGRDPLSPRGSFRSCRFHDPLLYVSLPGGPPWLRFPYLILYPTPSLVPKRQMCAPRRAPGMFTAFEGPSRRWPTLGTIFPSFFRVARCVSYGFKEPDSRGPAFVHFLLPRFLKQPSF